MDLDTTNNFHKGRWSFEEEINLVRAIKACLNVKKIDVSKKNDIDWVKVSKIMQTRSGSQCHLHWTKQVILKLPLMEEVLKTEYNLNEEEYERNQKKDSDSEIERKKGCKLKKKQSSKLKSKSKVHSKSEVRPDSDIRPKSHKNKKSAILKKTSHCKSKYKSVSEVESDTDSDSSSVSSTH